MDFKNTTSLSSALLKETFLQVTEAWPADRLVVRVRYSRGAEFSGTCIYDTHRIYVNLGRTLRYPYRMETYCARGRKAWGTYYKPGSWIELCDGYQVCLFIFAHEFYHWLIKQAGRNTAQKESMCDRFAAKILLQDYGCELRDAHGKILSPGAWDHQDLLGFVAAARQPEPTAAPLTLSRAARNALLPADGDQFLLFKR